MVPPALPEVGQTMLEGKLNYLVEEVPEVQDVGVSDNDRG